jgi:hypothetical protein
MRLLSELGRALLDAGSMTWQITWSLILGFTLSAVIQAVVQMMLALLGIFFLLVAAALVIRFVRSGSAPMLTMMGGCPEQHARDHSEVLLHDDARPAQQVLQTQVSDHQDTIAVPSMGKAPAPTVRSRD